MQFIKNWLFEQGISWKITWWINEKGIEGTKEKVG